ncbi:substrate-binding domain-containing protein [Paenibacillus xylaniclasticus]|uniref:substrate-binding domain-containing protein n=1 Tax=Paenibacillus xylaniclasticus TaxID=588083 RepID=UPI000FDB358C|nr:MULTISPECIES: substrate-binding domain-containing protein [Paenibacillus]GFN31505.1 sugar ABC transporter substrate-binding protein [Paenibacillus curdlanolyticus]
MSNKTATIGLIALFIIFAAVLSAFYASALRTRELAHSLTGAEPPSNAYRVTLIAQEVDNPFWQEVKLGASDAAKQLGITLEYTGPSRFDASEQSRLLAKAIAAKSDAVIVQGLNEPNYQTLIDHAVQSGIGVVTVDADEPNSKREAYVGTDNRKVGQQMGKLIAADTGGVGEVGVLIGSNSINQQLRLAGLRDVTDQYPLLHIVDIRTTGNSRLRALEQTTDMLSKHPNIDAIVGFSALDGSGMAEAVKEHMELTEQAAGSIEGSTSIQSPEIVMYAFDDLPETREAIAQCTLRGTIVQRPYEMGFEAVNQLQLRHRASSSESTQARAATGEHYTETSLMTVNSLGLPECP